MGQRGPAAGLGVGLGLLGIRGVCGGLRTLTPVMFFERRNGGAWLWQRSRAPRASPRGMGPVRRLRERQAVRAEHAWQVQQLLAAQHVRETQPRPEPPSPTALSQLVTVSRCARRTISQHVTCSCSPVPTEAEAPAASGVGPSPGLPNLSFSSKPVPGQLSRQASVAMAGMGASRESWRSRTQCQLQTAGEGKTRGATGQPPVPGTSLQRRRWRAAEGQQGACPASAPHPPRRGDPQKCPGHTAPNGPVGGAQGRSRRIGSIVGP